MGIYIYIYDLKVLYTHISVYRRVYSYICIRELCRMRARYEILTKATVKITVILEVTLCSLVDRYQRFGGTYCFHLRLTLMIEVIGLSEALVPLYRTARRHTLENRNL
jgi:hypothetical protein